MKRRATPGSQSVRLLTLALLLSSLSTSGCFESSRQRDGTRGNTDPQPRPAADPPTPEPASGTEQNATPPPTNAGDAYLRTGLNDFGFALYRQLADTSNENLFYSPLSVAEALGLVYAGAAAETATELRDAFQFPSDAAALGQQLRSFEQRLTDQAGEDPPHFTFTIANAAWVQSGFTLRDAYRRTVAESFAAQVAAVDFQSSPEAATRTINQWVARQTNDRIRELMNPASIRPETRLVLTNAVYFLGSWERPFDQQLTRPGPFTTAAGESVEVPLMRQTARFRYAEFDGGQVIALPYKGETLELVAVLPTEGQPLRALESTLTPARLEEWIAALQPERVHVVLPKFTVKWRDQLNQPLKALGVRAAFDPQAADLDRIALDAQLYVALVVHEAFVTVDEQGTEAAAATGVGIAITSIDPQRPKAFIADRPFLFLIRERTTGAVLFVGRLVQPEP